MDDRYHRGDHIARMIVAVSVLIMAICLVVFVVWVTRAEQNAKLYESDNVVCASQPFAIQCFRRQ